MTPQDYTPKQLAAFWNKVAITADDEQCWLWQGATTDGYGRKYWLGKFIGTHQLSWILAHGLISDGLQVLHTCDVRNCVNPKHLFLGTLLDNMKDMVKKGRSPNNKGERNPNCKISDEQIVEIRKRYVMGKILISDLAKEFGINRNQMANIVKYKKRI